MIFPLVLFGLLILFPLVLLILLPAFVAAAAAAGAAAGAPAGAPAGDGASRVAHARVLVVDRGLGVAGVGNRGVA